MVDIWNKKFFIEIHEWKKEQLSRYYLLYISILLEIQGKIIASEEYIIILMNRFGSGCVIYFSLLHLERTSPARL